MYVSAGSELVPVAGLASRGRMQDTMQTMVLEATAGGWALCEGQQAAMQHCHARVACDGLHLFTISAGLSGFL